MTARNPVSLGDALRGGRCMAVGAQLGPGIDAALALGKNLAEVKPTRRRVLPLTYMKRLLLLPLGLGMLASVQAGLLDDLAKPQQGRSMRATSTMRVGEVRRGGEEKLN